MANFEVFRWNFSSSTNPEIGRSAIAGYVQKKGKERLKEF